MNTLVLAAALAAAAIANGGDSSIVATLTVRGEAQLEKPADQLQIRLGVVNEAPEASVALKENSKAMANVIDALRKAGLGSDEYETGRFSIRLRYSRRPRQADPEWRPRIVGYEVTNTLAIKTKKLDLAGKLIGAANEAGANSIDSIAFGLADPRAHRAEAIVAATDNARSDAAVLARASSVELVRTITISLDDAVRRPPIPLARAENFAVAAAAIVPPIEAGDVTVRASVTIVYEIAPLE